MESIFEPQAYDEIHKRLEKLSPESQRQWGKMSVSQMLWHCQVPIRLALDNELLPVKGNWFLRTFFKSALYNDRPWRKNLPTIRSARAIEEKDFETEFQNLQQMLPELHALKDRKEWNPHPLFGNLSPEQWGKMHYKHLDHHLTQFGV